MAGQNRVMDHLFDSVVPLVEARGDERRVAVDGQSELGEIVRANREAVEIFEKLVGEDDVGRDLAHHDELEVVLSALESVCAKGLDDGSGLVERAHERDHDFDVVEPHLFPHALHGLAFEREASGEFFRDVARRAAKANHRVLFVGLVARAREKVRIFVGFEVRQANDDFLWMKGRAEHRDPLGELVHVKAHRIRVAAYALAHRRLQVHGQLVELEKCARMNADHVVNDELEPCEPDTCVRERGEVKCSFRVAHVHRHVERDLRHRVESNAVHVELEGAVIDESRIALGAAHRHGLTRMQ